MSSTSPYQAFWNWCFDKKPHSPIPMQDVLLKYNSPITQQFLLKSFVRHARLNHYLNKWINNIGVYYIEREELYLFIKKCIQDFKVKRKEIQFVPYKPKEALVEKLRKKFPTLKVYDVELLSAKIQKSKNRDAIYSALGMEKPKKSKLKKNRRKKKKSLKAFLAENFNTVKLKASEVKL